MGSWKGRGNQYIQFVRVLYCKLPTNGKQLPAFPLEAMPGTEPRRQRWEVTTLPPWPLYNMLKAILNCIVYFYSAQYLHVLQDSKCYLTHPTVHVQLNSEVTDIPLTERQRLKDDHLSTSFRFYNLPLGIGPYD